MFFVYVPFDTPRLRYVLDWILVERLGLEYALTQDANAIVHLSYGRESTNALSFPENGFLSRDKGLTQLPDIENWSLDNLDFDVFSAIFFLISRAEEYSAFKADRHGRFPAEQSVLFRKNWLNIPVVDVWVEKLREALNSRFSLSIPKPAFSFQPTYDIDIAYSYLHKGFRRTTGGLLRDLKKGNFRDFNARLKTLSGKRQDPYDAFDWMHNLHAQRNLKPIYFMLAAHAPGPFDKNIARHHPAMKMLAQSFAMEGTVGIHPSYTTTEFPEKISTEKDWLEGVTGKDIVHSRQHYIRLLFPYTYRQLLEAGIRQDYSMGLPDALGFRAGTSHSFFWYDLEKEIQTPLRIHPFAFMDTTARDYLGLSAPEAFAQLESIREKLLETGGVLTTIFHNFSLGTAPDWLGWQEGYRHFISRISQI